MQTISRIFVATLLACAVQYPLAQSISPSKEALVLLKDGRHEDAALAMSTMESRTIGVALASRSRYAEAAVYLRSASVRGFKTAQLEYAFLLESSDAPVRNLPEAFAWASLHTDGSDGDAKFARSICDRISKTLSSDDLAKAKARFERLRVNPLAEN